METKSNPGEGATVWCENTNRELWRGRELPVAVPADVAVAAAAKAESLRALKGFAISLYIRGLKR